MGELRDRMVRDMEVRNFSPRTIEAYVPWVRDLAKHYMRGPDQLTHDEVQNYLLQLHSERKLSSSTCLQAYSALKFFYAVTVRRPHASLLVPVRRGERLSAIRPRPVELVAHSAAGRRKNPFSLDRRRDDAFPGVDRRADRNRGVVGASVPNWRMAPHVEAGDHFQCSASSLQRSAA